MLPDHCTLCPRNCGVDRRTKTGYCNAGPTLKIARAALHHWEEPCLAGPCPEDSAFHGRGSGTVFFSHCNLQCIFCQNYQISSKGFGKEITISRLADIFLELQDKGAYNINLVTPTPWIPWILPALDQVKGKLKIPIAYNTGGYESVKTIEQLKGYVDIYLPDCKYVSPKLSQQFSGAADYFEAAALAIPAMLQQVGKPVFSSDGLLQRGVIIRHMPLPGCIKDSFAVLDFLASLPPHSFLFSLMSQYTPCYLAKKMPPLNRRISSYEYRKALDYALLLGLDHGYLQEKSSAKEEYTPPFDLEGVEITQKADCRASSQPPEK